MPGICVRVVLDFVFGAVGFLVNGAQRAGVEAKRGLRSRRDARTAAWIWDGVAAFGAAVFAGSEVVVALRAAIAWALSTAKMSYQPG